MVEKRRNLYPLIIICGGLLLFLAGLALVLSNQPAAEVVTPTPATVSQVQRVSLADAKAAFDDERATFVDVRDSSSYAAGHIPGAIFIPVSELSTRLKELNPNAWIITYCTWFEEETSARAALLLINNGFTNVTPILGGFSAWVKAGYPVESGQW
jgi:rhodanese-related sulfurtransferase